MKRSRHGLLLVLVALAASACESPTAPPEDTNTVVADWPAAQSLLDDPLLHGLPGYLLDNMAALPLRFALSELEAAVAARDADRLREAIARVAATRTSYAQRPGFRRGDLPLLAAIEIFELRAKQLLIEGGAALVATAGRGGEQTMTSTVGSTIGK